MLVKTCPNCENDCAEEEFCWSDILNQYVCFNCWSNLEDEKALPSEE